MMLWIWIVLTIMVCLFIVSFSRVNITTIYSREGEDDDFRIHIRALFGLLKYKFILPVIVFEGLTEGVSFRKETKNNVTHPSSRENVKVDQHDIIKSYEPLKKLINHVLGFHEWFVITLKRTHCTDIRWSTHIGLDDAAETAITTGIIWGLKTSILGYLLKHIKLEVQPQLAVIPHFNSQHFNMFFQCIINIRLGYAMLAGLHLLVRIYKVKGGLKTWQNILSKA